MQSLRYGGGAIAGTEENVCAIERLCTPSLKADEYNVRIVLDGDKSPSRYYSFCECPDGLHFCSHMLALILLLKVMQIQPEWNIATLKKMLPELIKTIQSLPISVDYVYRVLATRDKAVKERTAEMGKRWKARSHDGGTGVFSRELSAEHKGYSNDDHVDDVAIENASSAEPEPYLPRSVREWIEKYSLECFDSLETRITSPEVLCKLSSHDLKEIVRIYKMNRTNEVRFRKAVQAVSRVNFCAACVNFAHSMLARSDERSSHAGVGEGGSIGSSDLHIPNEALRKSPLDDIRFVQEQSATLNRLLVLVRNGICKSTMMPDYAEWDEFQLCRHRTLERSEFSEWADVSNIAVPKHLCEFVGTGGASQRSADRDGRK